MDLEQAELPEIDAQSQIKLSLVQLGTTHQIMIITVTSDQQVQSVVVELYHHALVVHILYKWPLHA
jgi:hypothetical protein